MVLEVLVVFWVLVGFGAWRSRLSVKISIFCFCCMMLVMRSFILARI